MRRRREAALSRQLQLRGRRHSVSGDKQVAEGCEWHQGASRPLWLTKSLHRAAAAVQATGRMAWVIYE